MSKKPRSRKDMIAFLSEHFRYSTMNSWNGSSSYAVNIKVSHMDLDKETKNAVYEMLDVEESWDMSGFNLAIEEFTDEHHGRWTIGANGRSGGYLVLYRAERVPSQYKSRCTVCYRKNYSADAKKCGYSPCPGAMVPYSGMEQKTFPGRGVDQDGDFESWSTDELRERVDLVMSFDRACKNAVNAYVEYAKEHRVVEETIMVPQKVKVVVEKEAE